MFRSHMLNKKYLIPEFSREDQREIDRLTQELIKDINLNYKKDLKKYRPESMIGVGENWLRQRGVDRRLFPGILTPVNLQKLAEKKIPPPSKRRADNWKGVLTGRTKSKSVFTISGGMPGTGKAN